MTDTVIVKGVLGHSSQNTTAIAGSKPPLYRAARLSAFGLGEDFTSKDTGPNLQHTPVVWQIAYACEEFALFPPPGGAKKSSLEPRGAKSQPSLTAWHRNPRLLRHWGFFILFKII